MANAVSTFRLFPVFSGVYLVGRPELSSDGVLKASLLAAGDGSALGARSAAAVWGFLDHRSPIEVFHANGGSNRRALLRVEGERGYRYVKVRRPRALCAEDLGKERNLAVTTPSRSLLDLAAVLSERRFRWAFAEADRLGLLDDEDLNRHAEGTQGRAGGKLFGSMVRRRLPNIGRAESLLESIVIGLTRDGQIPEPEVNQPTNGYRPDFRWRAQGLLVEADGYEFHRGREAFENDTLRANRLRAEGWTVLRFTWRMVTERPDEVAGMIRQAIEAGSTK